MGDECVDQGAVRVSGGRMHHQPGRLIDHDEVRVFVHHGERDGLALRLRGDRLRHGDVVDLSRFDPGIAVSYRLAGAADGALVEQGLQAGAAQIGQRSGEKPVESGTGLVRIDMCAAK